MVCTNKLSFYHNLFRILQSIANHSVRRKVFTLNELFIILFNDWINVNCRHKIVCRHFWKIESRVNVSQSKKMNINSLRCEFLLEILDRIYEKNTDIRNNINKSIEEIWRTKGVSSQMVLFLTLLLWTDICLRN